MKFVVLCALVLYCSSEVLGNPDKPQCKGIACDMPICPPGYILKYPGPKDTACCPYCEPKPQCERIQCDIPTCSPGYILKYPGPKDTACCPYCEPTNNN
uniref:Uncharacterized protein DDB_G0274171-like isoform X1 n=1 Tax=Diabrotica virgifera virgifera TaxID=50390 RepID=A0A6P7FRX9_DIAVI